MVTDDMKGTCNCSKPADGGFNASEHETDFTTKQ